MTARFDVAITETELIEILAKQVTSSTYVSMIVNHLKAKTADDLEELCRDISEIQRLSKTTDGNGGNQGQDQKEKEVLLTGTDFKGTCSYCDKKAGHKCKDCPERKKKMGELKCTGCGKLGHTKSNFWKAHPEKALQWMKDTSKKDQTLKSHWQASSWILRRSLCRSAIRSDQ